MIYTKLKKQIPQRLEKLKDSPLLFWEKNFYNSFKNCSTLTERQLSTLTKIEQRLSKINKEREEWLKEWDYQKELNFQIACTYYKHKGLYKIYKQYRHLISKTLSSPSTIPTRKQYTILVENKYVKRAIDAYFDNPKYNVGDLVYVVGDVGFRLSKYDHWIGLIIKPATKEFRKKEKKYVIKPLNKTPFGRMNNEFIVAEKYILPYRRLS